MITKKQVKICKCERCGGEWQPQGNEYPIRCAKCNSPYWNRKKVRK